jgi:hypothetical protein
MGETVAETAGKTARSRAPDTTCNLPYRFLLDDGFPLVCNDSIPKENAMNKTLSAAAGILAGATLMLAAAPALARVDIGVSIGTPGFPLVQPAPVYVPPPPVLVQPRPVYVQPPPVYVQPPPVYVQPRPMYVEPRPVYVQPRPVYVQPYPGHPQGRYRHGGRQDRDRDGIPDFRERDTDRDGVPNFRDRRPFDSSLY